MRAVTTKSSVPFELYNHVEFRLSKNTKINIARKPGKTSGNRNRGTKKRVPAQHPKGVP